MPPSLPASLLKAVALFPSSRHHPASFIHGKWQQKRPSPPVISLALYMNGWWTTTVTTSIFIAAAVIDWLDGYIVQKMRLGSAFGAFFVPVADKITMSAVRKWAASQNSRVLKAVAVNNLWKWKMATKMTALAILLAFRDSRAGVLVASGVVLLYVSAGLAIRSLDMRKIWRVLLK